METPTANKIQMMVAATATATVILITPGLVENKLTPLKHHALSIADDKKSWDRYTQTPYYTINGKHKYNTADYSHDIYISLPPKKHYLIKAKISHISKGEQTIITDDTYMDV